MALMQTGCSDAWAAGCFRSGEQTVWEELDAATVSRSRRVYANIATWNRIYDFVPARGQCVSEFELVGEFCRAKSAGRVDGDFDRHGRKHSGFAGEDQRGDYTSEKQVAS